MAHRFDSLLRMLALATLYLLAAIAAMKFGTVKGNVTVLWPSSGIALAALLLYGRRFWPGVFLGSLSAGLWIGDPLWVSITIAIGNTLDIVFGARLLQFAGFDAKLRRLRDYYCLFFLAGILAPIPGTLLGPAALMLTGFFAPAQLPAVALHWWMGGVLGIVLVVPILLVWRMAFFRKIRLLRLMEALTLLVTAWYVGMVVFLGVPFPITLKLYTMAFWIIPFMVWAALRFGRHGITLLLPMYFVQSLLGVMTGKGLFASDYQDTGLLNFWFFHILLNLAAMILAMVLHERKDATQQLEQAAYVFEHSKQAIFITDAQVRIVSVNRMFTEITGFSAEEVIGKNPRLLSSGMHDKMFYQAMWDSILSSGSWSGEIWNRRKDGSLYIAWLDICTVKSAAGEVLNYIGLSYDITERKTAEENVRHLAQHDFLTGLPNRVLFYDRSAQVLAAARRNRTSFAVFFLDLDRFKHINDTLGHRIGDELLKAVAKRLTDSMRATDTISRLGGDEFVILVPEVEGVEQARALADKLVEEFRQPCNFDGCEIVIGFSIGFAVYPENGENMDALLEVADSAMYRQKSSGKVRPM